MGFFRSVQATLRKAQAAVVVEKVLKALHATPGAPPGEVANRMVDSTCNHYQDLLRGELLPHKSALAAASLAFAIEALAKTDGPREMQVRLAACLGRVFMDMAPLIGTTNLNRLDLALLDFAERMYEDVDRSSPIKGL